MFAQFEKDECKPTRRKDKHCAEKNSERGIIHAASEKEHEFEKINNSGKQHCCTEKFYHKIHNERCAGTADRVGYSRQAYGSVLF